MKSQHKRTMSIWLSDDQIKQLEDQANQKGISRNRIVVEQLLKGPLSSQKPRNTTVERPEDTADPMIIVLSSHKGGIGKTVSAGNIAVEYAQQGFKTLVIDLDGQGSVSEYLHAYDESPDRKCIADIMIPTADGSRATIAEVKVPAMWVDEEGSCHVIENLEVVPSDLRFDNASDKMKSALMSGVDTRLYDSIMELKSEEPYDFIIIDCPPRVDLATTNAITALEAGRPESMMVIPVRPDGFSKRGLKSTVDALEAVAKARRREPGNWMLLKSISEPRTNLAQTLEPSIYKDYPNARFLKSSIEKAVIVMESSDFFTPLLYYAPNSKSRLQYRDLAREIAEVGHVVCDD